MMTWPTALVLIFCTPLGWIGLATSIVCLGVAGAMIVSEIRG